MVISYDKMSGVVLSSVTVCLSVCLSEEDAAPFLIFIQLAIEVKVKDHDV